MASALDNATKAIDPFARSYMAAYSKGAGRRPIPDDFAYRDDAGLKSGGYDSDAYAKAIKRWDFEQQQRVANASRAAAYARGRRQIRPKDFKPDIFDTLAQRYMDAELERLGANSTRARLGARPAGLLPGGGRAL